MLKQVATSALVPLLLLTSVASDALFLCRHDSLVRRACCCPERSEAPPRESRIEQAGCCELLAVRNEQSPSEAPRFAPSMVATPLVAEGTAQAQPLHVHALPLEAAGPLETSPPIVQLTCSRLI